MALMRGSGSVNSEIFELVLCAFFSARYERGKSELRIFPKRLAPKRLAPTLCVCFRVVASVMVPGVLHKSPQNEECELESAEKIPKNFAAMVEGGTVENTQRRRAMSHSAGVAKPVLVKRVEKPVSVRPTGAPEQVALGGKDGSFVSCLRVPGVSGYLIVC